MAEEPSADRFSPTPDPNTVRCNLPPFTHSNVAQSFVNAFTVSVQRSTTTVEPGRVVNAPSVQSSSLKSALPFSTRIAGKYGVLVTVSVPVPCFTAVMSPAHSTFFTLSTPSGLPEPRIRLHAAAFALVSMAEPETTRPFTPCSFPFRSR